MHNVENEIKHFGKTGQPPKHHPLFCQHCPSLHTTLKALALLPQITYTARKFEKE